MAQFTATLAENAPMLRAWLEAIVLAGHDEELRQTLAANQAEFRRALAATLEEAGSEDGHSCRRVDRKGVRGAMKAPRTDVKSARYALI